MFKKFFILTIAIIISLTTVGCSDVVNKKEEATSENSPNLKTQDWKESPLFESNGCTMIGEEGRLGLVLCQENGHVKQREIAEFIQLPFSD
jgi:hypothetical protein